MSRIAQVIVLAQSAEEVMEPLTRPDDSRSWKGEFRPLPMFADGWLTEFHRVHTRTGLLRHLESLEWPHPESVQVLIHDEEDDCFGLWMLRDGTLVELPVPGHHRLHPPAPETEEYAPAPGLLWRSGAAVPRGYSTERQDRRPAW
ncbi:hypothetical protein ACIA8O_31195 [Kitasatospora sp. NPDC051853]|uniref:hypothetical protein n=1 Tax=Kitasatospora sp. NPDC051853 TaxID=3364058 RepID=UPI0037A61738